MPDEPIINTGTRMPQLTAANAATDAELGLLPPGAGGWTPSVGQRIGLTVAMGILGSAAPVVIAAVPGPVGMLLAAVLGGAAAGFGALLGMNSAGPRKLP